MLDEASTRDGPARALAAAEQLPQPDLGNGRVLMLAEDVLERLRSLDEASAGLPGLFRGELGRIAGAFHGQAEPVEVGVGSLSIEPPGALAEAAERGRRDLVERDRRAECRRARRRRRARGTRSAGSHAPIEAPGRKPPASRCARARGSCNGRASRNRSPISKWAAASRSPARSTSRSRASPARRASQASSSRSRPAQLSSTSGRAARKRARSLRAATRKRRSSSSSQSPASGSRTARRAACTASTERRCSRGRLGSARNATATQRVYGGVPTRPVQGSAASGSTAAPRRRTSKWRCGPVERPVAPTRPTSSPDATRSPTPTAIRER